MTLDDPNEQFRAALDKAENLPPDEREAAGRAALMKLALAVAPEQARGGGLDFVNRDMSEMLNDARKKGSGGKVNTTEELLLRAITGHAVVLLKAGTPGRARMSSKQALAMVSRWSGLKPGTIKHWLPGSRNADTEPVLMTEVAKLLPPDLTEAAIRARVVKARQQATY